ncbi:MAG: SpoIID/LytB domain-containing protein [Blastocatellia bacterium]
MIGFEKEPVIRVGLMTGARSAQVSLRGRFVSEAGDSLAEGDYSASLDGGVVRLDREPGLGGPSILLRPADFDSCVFTVHDITIGIDFHWERKEAQQFKGALRLAATAEGLSLINELPLESYLVSVISSEMSASCPAELLRAHSVVSRSWLLAQLSRAAAGAQSGADLTDRGESLTAARPADEVIRWYDRESHADFDVCADDHCQRYQGISKAFSRQAFDAARETRGNVLVSGGEICDTRYSKSCGGMTELYRAAWEDREVPYLSPVYDGPGGVPGYRMPLADESNAAAWITSSPPAYCNNVPAELLGRILPGFDQETRDFYRWEICYSQDELCEITRAKLGTDFGRILALEPVERGESGRIIRLRIRGTARSLMVGKELEIRRALSRSHLYSSAFVVKTEQGGAEDGPARFRLIGAGWGHGVGLCQIGAAVMADEGRAHGEILAHYFRGATLRVLY